MEFAVFGNWASRSSHSPVEMVTDALRAQFLGKPKDISFQEVCAVFEHARNASCEVVQAWILAGYDTLEDLSRGLKRLRDLKVDVITSVFVPYTWEHIEWFKSQFPSEERLLYFLSVLHMVKSMGFKATPLHEANRALHFERPDEM